MLTPASQAKSFECQAEQAGDPAKGTGSAVMDLATDLPVEGFELSPQQRSLWALQQTAQGQPFRAFSAIRIEGDLNVPLLQQAIEELVSRHEILRTTFIRPPGIKSPFQVIAEAPQFSWTFADLSGLDETQQDIRISEQVAQNSDTHFDFTHGPLLHFTLIKRAADAHVLLVSLPALCSDSTTLANFTRELCDAYGKQLTQDEPLQYADFAEWQHELLEANDKDAHIGKTYWRNLQDANVPTLILPHEKRVVRSELFAPASIAVDLNSAGVEAFARSQGTSVSAVLFACWQALVWRLIGEPEPKFVLYSLFPGRKSEDVDDGLGLHAKYLPIVCHCDDESFSAHLRRITNALKEAAKWQEYFDPATSWSIGNSVAYDFEDRQLSYDAGDLSFRVIEQYACFSPFKLKLACVRSESTLSASLQYDTQVLDEETVKRFAGYFERFLSGVVHNPQSRLGDIEIVDAAERQRLEALNQTAAELPAAERIHELFEAQVRRTPSASAVVFGDEVLTYEQLNSRANQLAHLLRRRGVGPDVCVGLCVERSAEMIVGMLGILKAGGAYVPLNPDHPQERLATQLADSNSSLLITSGSANVEYGAELAGESIDLQRDCALLESESTSNPTPLATAENLVYVIYTSGSTGVPKGVAVRHRNLINYTKFILDYLKVDAPLTFATVSTITADLGNTVIFPALLSGGCLHVVDYDTSMEGDLLRNYFVKHRIDVLKIVPSHLGALLATQSDGGILPAKYLVLGGEALTWDLVQNISRFDHTCRIINHYGPTETTVGSLTFLVDEQRDSPYSATVAIGRPIANTRCYILDRRQRPAPLGVSGKLYVGGAGVSAGYLNRPAETADRFVPDPFSSDPNARLYRTGDLARYLPDYNIEFLGRADRQVKVRGYRVELDEIEAVLSRQAGVRQAVIALNRDQAGQERIVAYLVSARTSQDELRTALKQKLPDYMVPSVFIFLKSLPLTPNGKVDRTALPAPDDLRVGLQMDFVAPRSDVEKALAGIWANLLKLEIVGVHDNFFDLGGHSLLATQLVSRVRKEFRIELPLRSLFETPTVAALAEKIEKATADNTADTIKPRLKRESAVASFAQQRLWFLDQLEDNRALYNVPRALRLTGSLDIDALQRALNQLVSRHEPFRTHFETVDGVLRQIISDHAEIALTRSDLSDLPAGEKEERAKQVTREEAGRPFDLAQGPVIRAQLLRLDEQEHILLLTTHHIVSDAWSAGILFKELGDLYNALSEQKPPPLAALPIQYADFAEWQRTWLQNEVLGQQVSYWRSKLDGMATLDLPTDHARTTAEGSHGAYQHLTLSQSLSERLTELSKREGATLFMTLLAAFQILLSRYSGQDDIAVGSPIAGRNREEIENLIGFFINTLVLRTDLSGKPTFRELLENVKDTAVAAYAHQDLPFEKLVEELQPERDMARNPLFQVMFQFQNALPAPMQLNGLEVSKLETFTQTAKFDLMLVAYEQDGALKCLMEYDTGLFASATIERMLNQYATLLESIVATPEHPIADLTLLSAAEQRQLLVDWNNTQTDFPREQTIHQLFQEQAARTPDQLAIVYDNERVTYGELNARANQLAHHLSPRGAGPEVRVAICLERSVEMIVALLAVLKAGAAYVPLEPRYPADRTAFILQDSQARLLLTQHRFRDSLPASGVETIYLDGEMLTPESAADSQVLTSAENAAHVIYTSGSTGQPKGVISAHHASVNRFAWMWRTYPFAAGEVCCQKTALSFVDSIWEIFGPLLQGVPLVIIPDDVVKDPDQLLDALAVNQVTRLVLVPSLLRVMLDGSADLSRKLGHLRYCVCSGETLPVDLASAFREQLPNTKLINLYGSSEVAADVTCYEVDDTHGLNSIPIGRPIANTDLYILDADFQLAPVGAMGEICVSGEGLARGYLDRAELTAEKFVPHPFSKQPGARLFRTGDIGRYLPDGNVEYRGRRDHQVKVRGFRVELGEIEATLANHPQVEQAIVVAVDGERGDKHLVAYVSANGEAPANSELRAHLRRTLADYMIPAGFVLLDKFPLTASGKINRLALPKPKPGEFATRADFIAPRTPTEEVLASIWSNILDVADVGAQDDFFALGGHSLLLVQVASHIREAFQIELPLRSLFEAPMLGTLADRIDAARRMAEGLEDVPLIVVQRNEKLPLSFAQERLWVFEQLEPDTGAYNIPRVLRLHGPLDVAALEKSIDTILERHEVLRTSFLEVDGKPVLSIAESVTLEVPVFNLTTLPEDERNERIRELTTHETQRPFDLSRAPLLRLALVRLGGGEHLLIMTMHHLICDAWSIGVFMRELVAGYNSFTNDNTPSLPVLPVQYVDFAVWQRNELTGAPLQKQLDYWRNKLAGAPAVIGLPTDRSRPSTRSFHGARRSFVIPTEIREKLKVVARSERATLFMTLLTAFQSLLSCLANETDIVVGSPIAGRNRPETEPLIGYFVNTLVLRADLSGDPTFREGVRRTRDTSLGAFANQDVPFDKLVEDLNPARTAAYNPLFQVWFVMQQPFAGPHEFNGLAMQYLDSGTALTRHDLQLSLWESAKGLEGALTYSTALFDAETIDCIAEQFKAVLSVVVEQPETRLSDLRALVNETGRAYRAKAIADLEGTSRLKLKSAKRKVVVDVPATAVEESWTNPNQ